MATQANKNGETHGPRAGSGLCYSLALFLAHHAHFKYVLAEVELLAAEGALQFEGKESANPENVRRTIGRLAATRWFSTAAMPLRALQIPDDLPGSLRERLHHLKESTQKWMFPWGHRHPSPDSVLWAIGEAKELIRAIDESRGVPTVKEEPATTSLSEPILRFCDKDQPE